MARTQAERRRVDSRAGGAERRRCERMVQGSPHHAPRCALRGEVVRPDSVDERIAIASRIPDQLETELAPTRTGDRGDRADIGCATRSDQIHADPALRRSRVGIRAGATGEIS